MAIKLIFKMGKCVQRLSKVFLAKTGVLNYLLHESGVVQRLNTEFYILGLPIVTNQVYTCV